MDGRQRAVQSRRGAQLPEGGIGFLLHQRTQLVLLAGDVAGLAAGTMVLRPHLTEATALLEELLDHAQRNAKPAGYGFPGAFPRVIGRQNPFAQIQGDRCHGRSLTWTGTNGYVFN